VTINWGITPFECAIQISIDGNEWLQAIPWRNCLNPDIDNPLPEIDESKETLYKKYASYN